MTITPDIISEALRQRVEETFPGEAIYENLMPEDFQRPSNLLELVKIELDPLSMGQGTVLLRYQYKITTFSEVDKVHDSHLPTLDLRAMLLLGAFASGYVKVGDRAPKVSSLTANTSLYDAAEVMLTLTLPVDRSDFAPETLLPVMQELTTRYVKKEENES
ncbi:hypothetical protein [Dysosmobacter sp.]